MPLLSGVDIDGNIRVRVTDNNNVEVRDILLNLFDKRSGVILPTFGELFFFLLPNGRVTGVDNQTIKTGFFAVVQDVGTSIVATTDITDDSKVDRYETENTVVFKVSGSKENISITSQVFLYSVLIKYRGISDNQAVTYDLIQSTILGNSVFAELPNANATRKGVKIPAGHKLSISYQLSISISK